MAVNKPIKVQEGQFIAVSSHDDKTSVDQINEWRGDADLILSDKAAIIVNLDTLHSTADTANSEVATLAANEQEQPSNQLPAAISFEKSNAKVVSEGGDLILKGNYDATKTTQIFQDAENDGVTMEGKDITVRSNSNRFIATLKAGENTGAVTFTYNKDPNTPSNPVKTTSIKVRTRTMVVTLAVLALMVVATATVLTTTTCSRSLKRMLIPYTLLRTCRPLLVLLTQLYAQVKAPLKLLPPVWIQA